MKTPNPGFFSRARGTRLFHVALALALPGLALLAPAAGAGEPLVTRDGFDAASAYEHQTGCQIRIDSDEELGITATVSLVFPDSGYSVAWGEVAREGHRFSVELAITRHDGPVLPVITTRSHTYALGDLTDGAYRFEVYLRSGKFVQGKSFHIVDGEPARPPLPAHVRLATEQHGEAVALIAAVGFHEPGYRVADWGEPLWRGNEITIHAEAVREVETIDRLDKNRHRYHLGEPGPGEYHVEFHLNGFPMARHTFQVHDEPWPGLVHFQPVDITEPGTGAHPLTVIFRHPDDIDTDSFGSRDLRVIGPGGFERHARFVDWELSMDRMWPQGYVAYYEIDPPGRYWTPEDNGRYAVVLEESEVRTGGGESFPRQRLGAFAVALDHEPRPPVRFVSLDVFPDDSADPVRHRAKLTVELASSDVQVASWGTPERRNGFFWVNLDIKWGEVGLPVTREESHTYDLGVLEPGRYGFVVYANTVRIGRDSFRVAGDVFPQAEVRAETATKPSPDPHPFLVRYRSPNPMDLESIRKTALRVAGPNGYRAEVRPESLEVYADSDRRFTQALYRAPAPRGGWKEHDNGFYRITVPPHSIRDEAGRYLPGGAIGGFAVRIHDETRPGRPSAEFTVRDDDGIARAHLRFLPGDSGWRIEEWAERPLVRGSDFIVRVRIDEEAANTDPQENTYRLGRLLPGYYTFQVKGSNGFVSRHVFRIGDHPPVRPFEAWRTAAAEIAGIEEHERHSRLTLRAYAFGLDPVSANRETILRAERSYDETGSLRLTATYPEIGSAADLDYRVDLSPDLEHWVDATGLVDTIDVVEKGDGRYWRTVELSDEAAETGAGFIRVRAVIRGDDAPAP